ncbi:hypothetical protein Xmir_03042 [Xenorhabdus miraniensis]|uniref:Uncharacterized protein n=1 Tax=Xenorhabdus miraniensis TaxID=351674 RepID=A0A2D0JN71_9GAMM|nr:hypothetical protein Xmir_03042 [Xenorhabdus miraniensis]
MPAPASPGCAPARLPDFPALAAYSRISVPGQTAAPHSPSILMSHHHPPPTIQRDSWFVPVLLKIQNRPAYYLADLKDYCAGNSTGR